MTDPIHASGEARLTNLQRVTDAALAHLSLADLLDEHRAPETVDFLSVDTEGTELRILRAFDFSRHRPRLIAVEHNGRDQQELDALMAAHGYERRFRRLSDWDAWYRLLTPSGVGDGYSARTSSE